MMSNKMTQADIKRMMELVQMGVEDNLELSLELKTLVVRSGILDANKCADKTISQHPEVEYINNGVRVTTTNKAEYHLNLRAIERDPVMFERYTLALEARRAEVQPTMTDLGLRSTRASDLKYLSKKLNHSWRVNAKMV